MDMSSRDSHLETQGEYLLNWHDNHQNASIVHWMLLKLEINLYFNLFTQKFYLININSLPGIGDITKTPVIFSQHGKRKEYYNESDDVISMNSFELNS